MQSSSTVAIGNVISQSPAAGSHVASGSAVNLVISTGPVQVAVPNVVGDTQSAATTAITGAGLMVGPVILQSSSTVAVGNVINQNPAAGSSVASGSAVNLLISLGYPQVAVPNVVGDTLSVAMTAINDAGTATNNAGLTVGTVTPQSSSTVAVGNVISQSPAAGTSVDVYSDVNLVISSTDTVLYSFGAYSGDALMPQGSVIQGIDGNFYGAASKGGANGQGTVFKLTPSGVETIVYSFGASSTDGIAPMGVIQGRDGNFYGTTILGGVNDHGTLFKLTAAGVETVLHSFGASTTDAADPTAVIQGADGNFYGTTEDGGANGDGTIFKLTPAGIESVLYSFGAYSGDGSTPTELIQGTDGNFYGTTASGGANSYGTVFKLTPAGVESALYSFGYYSNGLLASGPNGLVQGKDGNFYGTATGFVGSGGIAFKITPAGVETVLHSFEGSLTDTDGLYPNSVLIQGTDGNFYGTTSGGGAYCKACMPPTEFSPSPYGDGTVFKIIP
jgi:uncharacterized repeat protein (TIGR03803 family)